MSELAITAICGAIPATLAAFASIISARRSGTNTSTIEEIRDDVSQLRNEKHTDHELLRAMIQQHIENQEIHRG